MNRSILVPIDLTANSPPVVAWSESLARDRQAKLVLLHVQEPIIENLGGEVYYPMPILENPLVQKALEAVHPTDPAVPYEHRLVLGSAPDQILHAAAQEHAELIVMGSHGRHGLSRILMGSVAEAVMRRARCPVLIVKATAAEDAAAGQATTHATASGANGR